MAKSAPIRDSRRFAKWRVAPKWQIGICLLLVALIIYNPYLAGAESGAGLCVRHSASNRATVGASELQHFSPIDGRSILAATAVTFRQFDGVPSIASEPREVAVEQVFLAVQ